MTPPRRRESDKPFGNKSRLLYRRKCSAFLKAGSLPACAIREDDVDKSELSAQNLQPAYGFISFLLLLSQLILAHISDVIHFHAKLNSHESR